jgi:hypothetical protein
MRNFNYESRCKKLFLMSSNPRKAEKRGKKVSEKRFKAEQQREIGE